MSSGERAKPPASFEERNPFDISRRSGPEVAAEIARRMAAWKQARGRAHAAPTTAAPSEAAAAPVQPPRLPRGSQPAAPGLAAAETDRAADARAEGKRAPRAPFFATFSVRRAATTAAGANRTSGSAPVMEKGRAVPLDQQADDKLADDKQAMRADPAQTLRTGRAEAEAARDAQPGGAAVAAAVPERAAVGETQVESIAGTAMAAAEQPTVGDSRDTAAVASESAPPESTTEATKVAAAPAHETAGTANTPVPAGPALAGVTEERDPIAPEPVLASCESPATDAADAAAGIAADPALPAEAPAASVATPSAPAEAAEKQEPVAPEPVLASGESPAADAADAAAGIAADPALPAEAPAAMVASAATPGAAAEQPEPALPKAVPAPTDDPVAASPAEAARGDRMATVMAGEPAGSLEDASTDSVAPTASRPAEASAAPAEPRLATEHAERPAMDEMECRRAKARDLKARWMAARAFDGLPSDEAGLTESGTAAPARPEVFRADAGARQAAVPPADARADAAVAAPEAERAPAPTATQGGAAGMGGARMEAGPGDAASSMPSIESLDEMVGRREPTLAGPRGAAEAVGRSHRGARGAPIALPRIETRIEARRIAALRADPVIAGRAPADSGGDRDAIEIPSPYPACARRRRGGTGWAIGLGATLLIIGITAPAAIWQQERLGTPTDQDRVVLELDPRLPPQQASQPSAQSSGWSERPGAEHAQLSSRDAGAAPEGELAALPQPEIKPGTGTDSPVGQALGPVKAGGAVDEVPVTAPPPPWMTAQVPRAEPLPRPGSGFADAAPSAMVPRPFVPQQAAKPFVPAATAGGASVPVSAAPAGGSTGASVALKPTLMGQLKPKLPAARKPAAPQSSVRKPKPFMPQSLDQMFQQLVDALANGQPVNPATKPVSPSHRR